MYDDKERMRFVRLANAMLKSQFTYGPQRRAYVAKMWIRYNKRLNDRIKKWIKGSRDENS